MICNIFFLYLVKSNCSTCSNLFSCQLIVPTQIGSNTRSKRRQCFSSIFFEYWFDSLCHRFHFYLLVSIKCIFSLYSRTSWEHVPQLWLRRSDQVGLRRRVLQRAGHLHLYREEARGHDLLPGSRHRLPSGQRSLTTGCSPCECEFVLTEHCPLLARVRQELDVDPKEMNRETPEETGIYFLSSSLPQHCLYTRVSSLQKLKVKCFRSRT